MAHSLHVSPERLVVIDTGSDLWPVWCQVIIFIPMLTYSQFNPAEQTSDTFKSNYIYFHPTKYILKMSSVKYRSFCSTICFCGCDIWSTYCTVPLCSSEIQDSYNCFTCTPVSHNLQNIQDNVIQVMDILGSVGLCDFENKQQKQWIWKYHEISEYLGGNFEWYRLISEYVFNQFITDWSLEILCIRDHHFALWWSPT